MTEPTAAATRRPPRNLLNHRADLGLWPVVIGLVLIAAGFQLANAAFLSPRNLSNLILQTGTLSMLTLGVMLVLLLGEIDLSVGVVSGLAASVMGIVSTLHGWPAWAAIGLAVVVGGLIGALQGAWIVTFRAPSFIVTLSGMLVWQGLQLRALSSQSGQLRITDETITDIASTYLPRAVGWGAGILVLVVGVGAVLVRRRLSTRAGYDTDPWGVDLGKIALVVVVTLGILTVLDRYLGVPTMLTIVVCVTAVLSVMTGSTVFGRHIYAVGGNAEAARRTGIRVGPLRLVVFVLASSLAALGGVLEAARQYSVSVSSGGGNASLNAIAAAVIGGTSLFGGRGRIVGALLGALVISGVQNGLALIGQTASTQVIATGIILLAAVTFDMTARRRRLGGRG